MTVQKGGWDYFDGENAGITQYTLQAGERNVDSPTNSYSVNHEECNYTSWAHGDGDTIITNAPAFIYGVFINSTLTGDFAVRDGTDATGTLLLTTANNATALTEYYFPAAIRCETGIFVDDNATGGNALILWRPI